MKDKTIGKQIKKARIELGYTQSKLGKLVGVTWEMISRYENAKSSPKKNLEKIAKALKKPIQYFYGVEEIPIREEISKLMDLLNKKGKSFSNETDVFYFEKIKKKILDSGKMPVSKTYYPSPVWVKKVYQNVFALKLANIQKSGIEFTHKDIGFFARTNELNRRNFVLIYKNNKLSIQKFDFHLKKYVVGLLVALERKLV